MAGLLRDCTASAEDKLLGGSVAIEPQAPVAEATAGVVTYSAAQILRGILARDPNGASRVDVFPTAALLVAALAAKYGAAQVGMRLEFTLCNNADAAETITVTLGAGMTSAITGGTQVSAALAQNATRRYMFVVTNVTAAAEAITVFA